MSNQTYNVIITSRNHARSIESSKVVQSIMNINKYEAAELLSHLPAIIISGATQKRADTVRLRLEDAGCTVTLEQCDSVEIDGATNAQIPDEISKAAKEREMEFVNTEFNKHIVRAVTCPYCHSTNVEKITLGKRVVKGYLWGAAAANTLVKEWHCKNCKSNF